LLRGELLIFQKTLDAGMPNIRKHPGDRTTSVVRLVRASRTCIFAEVRVNQNALVVQPVGFAPATYDALAPRSSDDGLTGVNTTHWVYSYNLALKIRTSSVRDPCVT
jgi:hypothetical protein